MAGNLGFECAATSTALDHFSGKRLQVQAARRCEECLSGPSRPFRDSLELLDDCYRIPIRRRMSEKRTDLLRGTLDLLVLKTLSLEPLHGVGISRRITQITQGAFQVSFGSLFPSLHRMEERGWVEAEWRTSENNRRAKYYRLTLSGRKQITIEERDWNQVVKIMTTAIQST